MTSVEKHFKLCARCRMVRYCSKECQSADWSRHRLECGTVEKKEKKIITRWLKRKGLLIREVIRLLLTPKILKTNTLLFQLSYTPGAKPPILVENVNVILAPTRAPAGFSTDLLGFDCLVRVSFNVRNVDTGKITTVGQEKRLFKEKFYKDDKKLMYVIADLNKEASHLDYFE